MWISKSKRRWSFIDVNDVIIENWGTFYRERSVYLNCGFDHEANDLFGLIRPSPIYSFKNFPSFFHSLYFFYLKNCKKNFWKNFSDFSNFHIFLLFVLYHIIFYCLFYHRSKMAMDRIRKALSFRQIERVSLLLFYYNKFLEKNFHTINCHGVSLTRKDECLSLTYSSFFKNPCIYYYSICS